MLAFFIKGNDLFWGVVTFEKRPRLYILKNNMLCIFHELFNSSAWQRPIWKRAAEHWGQNSFNKLVNTHSCRLLLLRTYEHLEMLSLKLIFVGDRQEREGLLAVNAPLFVFNKFDPVMPLCGVLGSAKTWCNRRISGAEVRRQHY